MATDAQSVPPLVVVVGPTASGKTALAVRLAEALGGEVVSADSVQVYRAFDIGAGKPSRDERTRVRHHLIDVVDPLEPMDAARWVALADLAIAEVRARGRIPIVCGGTFLWVRSLLRGLAPMPPADPDVRARHAALAERYGRAHLHGELGRIDPEAALRLAPNDFVRVSRALEVFELTGTPQSAWHGRHGLREERYPARFVGVRFGHDDLARRIEARVRAMFAEGWVEEVQGLVAGGYGEARAMKSVGYRQIALALRGGAVDEAVVGAEIAQKTRIFARRQRTWLRDLPVQWLGEQDALEGRLDPILFEP